MMMMMIGNRDDIMQGREPHSELKQKEYWPVIKGSYGCCRLIYQSVLVGPAWK